MSLHAEMLEQEFTEEMTHRVVRHGSRSPEARAALRFAKRHPNSKFLKIARFKIAEQERFDVENGLASPWVRVLHFLDEEVFDRLRLGSIGQVLAVSGFVLAILFLSDGARSLFRSPEPPTRGPSDAALEALSKRDPSPVEEWIRRELTNALDSPEVRSRFQAALVPPSSAAAAPVPTDGPDEALRKRELMQSLTRSLTTLPMTEAQFQDHLESAILKGVDTGEMRTTLLVAIKQPEVRQALLQAFSDISLQSSERASAILEKWERREPIPVAPNADSAATASTNSR